MKERPLLGEWAWFIKNSILIVIYAIVALHLYDVIAEISVQLHEPTTLFTPIDHLVPFISAFAIIYVFIFYPFVIYTLGYFMYIKPEKANRFFIAIMIIYAISYMTYLIFPVMMIRPKELPDDFLSRVMAKYYESDPPYNCFPSLHAANATITAYYLGREKPEYKYVFWLIAFLVMLSTLFVRQHVIADEIAGFLVAYFAGWISEKKIPLSAEVKKRVKERIIFTVILGAIVVMFVIMGYLP